MQKQQLVQYLNYRKYCCTLLHWCLYNHLLKQNLFVRLQHLMYLDAIRKKHQQRRPIQYQKCRKKTTPCRWYSADRGQWFVPYLHLSLFYFKGGDTVSVLNAGLPNITGLVSPQNGYATSIAHGNSLTGALYIRSDGSNGGQARIDGTSLYKGWGFDASRSCAIYGASTTVQPPAISLIKQIRF